MRFGFRYCLPLALLPGILLFPTHFLAADEQPQIQPRTRIVTTQNAEIKTGAGLREKLSPGEVIIVTQQNQDWLWIPLESGWIKESDVKAPAELVTFLDQALKTKPSVERYQLRGIAYQVLKDYDAALVDFNAALALKADQPRIYVNRGNVWRLKQEHGKALADLTQALELDPKNVQALQIRGLVYLETGEPAQAITDLSRALKLNPRLISALNARGVAYREKNQIEEALQDFNQAIQLNNFVSEVFSNRAGIWEQKQQFHSAIKDYLRALELNPQSAVAHNDLAWLYATCPVATFRQPQQAVTHARKACELTAFGDWNLLDTLATAYRASQQPDQAAQTLRQAIAQAPDEAKPMLKKKLKNFTK